MHVGFFARARLVRSAVSLANACEPDITVLTGDFLSYRCMHYFRDAAPELEALHAPLGVFACLGNHDHWEDADEVRAILEDVGVRVLVDESARLADGLWLAGVDDLMIREPDLERTAAGIPDGAAVVLLSHSPMILPYVADRPWLVLAGHTHGGQVALPFIGPRGTARVPGVKWLMHAWERSGVRRHGGRVEAVSGHRYPEGWYQEGRATMYVNRGIGINQMWPIRLNCPAEIACFSLRRSVE
jgi:predicted MPP superfamily phosphohydrolase